MERELGFLVNGKVNMSHGALTARTANPVLWGIRDSIASWARDGIVLLCSALGWP